MANGKRFSDKLIEMLTACAVMPVRERVDRVLGPVNAAREALGLDHLDALPHGNPGFALSCPLSVALDAMVGVDGACFTDEQKAKQVSRVWGTSCRRAPNGAWIANLPAALARFVRDFDLGAYPALNLERLAGPAPAMSMFARA